MKRIKYIIPAPMLRAGIFYVRHQNFGAKIHSCKNTDNASDVLYERF